MSCFTVLLLLICKAGEGWGGGEGGEGEGGEGEEADDIYIDGRL